MKRHVNQIKKQLGLRSPQQMAWQSLSAKERSVFIKLAGLTANYTRLIKPDFDSFHPRFQSQLTNAIQLAANIAGKFNAKLVPVQLPKKQLKAA